MNQTPEQKARSKIDSELEKRGWNKLQRDESGTGYKEEVSDTEGKRADYVLYINSEPYAIIEAKAESKHVETHLQQARNYAKALESNQTYNNVYSVPFVYASNGEEIIIDDLRELAPKKRETKSFYSPEDIKRKLKINHKKAIAKLKQQDYTDIDKKLWENQQEGLKEIKDGLFNQYPKMFVSMATGSGKTRMAMALVYQLLETDYLDKVLFVPDTTELRKTAKSSFESYNPPNKTRFSDKYSVKNFNEYKNRKSNTDVVVSTIQKLRIELNNNNDEYTPGEFDLIIADECHRGVYNQEGYGYALDFYDGIELGLTATPHEKTIERYDGNHVYEFTYHEAKDMGHVVDYEPYKIDTKINMKGYKQYTPRQIGIDVIIEDTHRKVAEKLKDYIDVEDDLTLVFAQNIKHAENIAKIFREVYRTKFENPEEAIKVASSEHTHSDKTLEDFRRKVDDDPKIVVTVDMVSTGVDIKPLNNLVFLRAVKSKILFNQMMGRGTRTYEDKTEFKIFDCLNILEYHNDTPPFNTKPIKTKEITKTIDYETSESVKPETISKKDIDKIVDSKQLYPTETELVSAEEYLDSVNNVIYKNSELIKNQIQNCSSIQEANEKIEEILKDKSEFYEPKYILSANNADMIENIFEYTRHVLLNSYSIKNQSNIAKNIILEKYNLNEEQKKWNSKINERTIVENKTISKEKLLNPPFSNIGGYDTAKKVFSENPSLEEVINIYNKHILDLEPP